MDQECPCIHHGEHEQGQIEGARVVEVEGGQKQIIIIARIN